MAANKKTVNRQRRELSEMGGNYAIWALKISKITHVPFEFKTKAATARNLDRLPK